MHFNTNAGERGAGNVGHGAGESLVGGIVLQDETGTGARTPVGIGEAVLGGGFLPATRTASGTFVALGTFAAFTRAAMFTRSFAAASFTAGFDCRTGGEAERKQEGDCREHKPARRSGRESVKRRLLILMHHNLLHRHDCLRRPLTCPCSKRSRAVNESGTLD